MPTHARVTDQIMSGSSNRCQVNYTAVSLATGELARAWFTHVDQDDYTYVP
jgi:hypothetical protein